MLSDEEKEEAWSETEIRFRADLLILNSEFPTHRKTEAMEELLEIYNKQSKEIEEYKKQLDLDNECEIALNNKVMDLEKENEKLNKLHVQDNKHLDFIMKHSVPVQKIKDKIEELDYKDIGNFERRCQQEVLQSLLEKE